MNSSDSISSAPLRGLSQIFACLMLVSCPQASPRQVTPPPPPVTPPVSSQITSVNLTVSSISVESGKTVELNANVEGTGSFDPSIMWSLIGGDGFILSGDTGPKVTLTAPIVTGASEVIVRATAKADEGKFSQIKISAAPPIAPLVVGSVLVGPCKFERTNPPGCPNFVTNIVDILVHIDTKYQIKSVKAQILGTQVSGDLVIDQNYSLYCDKCWKVDLDFKGFPRGFYTAQVFAEDIQGNTSTASTVFLRNEYPKLTVNQPTANVINSSPVSFDATCTDDAPGCIIGISTAPALDIPSQILFLTSGSKLSTTLNFPSGFDTTLYIVALDSDSGRTVAERRITIP
jgi:hypothetical protein